MFCKVGGQEKARTGHVSLSSGPHESAKHLERAIDNRDNSKPHQFDCPDCASSVGDSPFLERLDLLALHSTQLVDLLLEAVQAVGHLVSSLLILPRRAVCLAEDKSRADHEQERFGQVGRAVLHSSARVSDERREMGGGAECRDMQGAHGPALE